MAHQGFGLWKFTPLKADGLHSVTDMVLLQHNGQGQH